MQFRPFVSVVAVAPEAVLLVEDREDENLWGGEEGLTETFEPPMSLVP